MKAKVQAERNKVKTIERFIKVTLYQPESSVIHVQYMHEYDTFWQENMKGPQ